MHQILSNCAPTSPLWIWIQKVSSIPVIKASRENAQRPEHEDAAPHLRSTAQSVIAVQKAGSLDDPCWRAPPTSSPARPTENGVHLASHQNDLFCNPNFCFGVPSAKFLEFDGPGGQAMAQREAPHASADASPQG